MADPVPVNFPAPGTPRPPAGAPQRLRAIDTLLADRAQLFQALVLGAPIAEALVAPEGHILVPSGVRCGLPQLPPEDLTARHVARLAPPPVPTVTDLSVLPA